MSQEQGTIFHEIKKHYIISQILDFKNLSFFSLSPKYVVQAGEQRITKKVIKKM